MDFKFDINILKSYHIRKPYLKGDNMKETIKASGAFVILVSLIIFVLAIGPAIIYFVWPLLIPSIFPGLVSEGYIAESLSFLDSVLLMILTSVLFKTFSSRSSKNDR